MVPGPGPVKTIGRAIPNRSPTQRDFMALAIETHKLTRFFGDFCAVDGIDLRIEGGTFYGFLGPNGAGKSTTIKMLTGLLAPSAGQILVLGRNVLDPAQALEVKRRIGVVPEDLALFDNLTAREYLTFVGRMYLLQRDTIRSRIDELLPVLGLENEEKKLTLEYSHGMKKKLALAAALLPNPDLLFLDEPFEGVDAVTSRVIRDLLAGFVARGSTVFLTSHVLEIVERLCTHVGIIVKGSLVEQDSLEAIRRGNSLENRFLEKAGAEAEMAGKLRLARGGDNVNPQHLRAFLWLRWRLRINQLRRGGIANVVLLSILGGGFVLLALGLFVGLFIAGWHLAPDEQKESSTIVLFVWDGLVVCFLFLWMTGLLADLQRSEPLSLGKFMHLPVSATGVFIMNYLSSLFSLTLLFFVPAMTGLTLGLVVSRGPGMLLVFPLVAAFLLMTTALTYQFQGWLAALMANPRRRRTIVVMLTFAFILIFQLPNMLNLLRMSWQEQSQKPASSQEQEAKTNEFNKAEAELQRARSELREAAASKKITPAEFRRQSQELTKREQELNEHNRVMAELHDNQLAQKQEEGRVVLAKAGHTARYVNLFLPPGWLPLGAMAAADGKVWPALLGTLGLASIGGVSLWRSYRTTLRLFLGQLQPGQRRPVQLNPVAKVATPTDSFLARELPWVSEHAAAIALASFRSIMRAPEAKMMLLSPLFMMIVFGCLLITNRANPPEAFRPLLATGAMGMILLTMGQMIGNQFGFDRNGFRVFVLCPAPRREIILGKNLALAPLTLGMGLVAAVVVQVAYPMRLDYFLAFLPQMVSMFLLYCLLANCLSILVPVRIAAGTMKAMNPKAIPILLHLAFVLVFPPVLGLTLLPLAIQLLMEALGQTHGVPVALILSLLECSAVVFFYRLALTWEGAFLQSREQKILEAVTTKEE